jgi:hypothetical protein
VLPILSDLEEKILDSCLSNTRQAASLPALTDLDKVALLEAVLLFLLSSIFEAFVIRTKFPEPLRL